MKQLMLAALVLTGIEKVAADAVPKMDVVITSRDGVKLKGTYFSPGDPGPGIVLVLGFAPSAAADEKELKRFQGDWQVVSVTLNGETIKQDGLKGKRLFPMPKEWPAAAAALAASASADVRNQAGNEIREQFLSAAKARRELGWRPLFALEEGLARTIAWYRAFLDASNHSLARAA